MRPSSGYSSPMIILMSVDFPVPLSPMSAIRSPPATLRSTPENSVRSPRDLPTPLSVSTSSPRNSLLRNCAVIFFSRVGLSVVRIRSIRFSIENARLCSASLPMNAHRCSLSAAASSCLILACSFSYCRIFSR